MAEGLTWLTDYPQALETAKKANKFVLVDIGSDGWGGCKKLETVTFSDAKVIAELQKDFVTVHINISKDPDTAGALEVMAVPDVRILNPKGLVVMQQVGFIPPPAMLKKIEDARAKAG